MAPEHPLLTSWITSRHFDGTSVDRGRGYARNGRVFLSTTHPDETGALRAGVRGSAGRRYQVTVWPYADPPRAQCTCPIGEAGRCKHVVAFLCLLPADLTGAPPPPPPRPEMTPEALQAWAAEHDVEDLLATSVWVAVHSGAGHLRTALSMTRAQAITGAQVHPNDRERCMRELAATATQRRTTSEAERRAHAWRSTPPKEPALQPLCAWLWAQRTQARQTERPREVVDQLRVDEDDAVVIAPGYRLDFGGPEPRLHTHHEERLPFLEGLLDALTAPDAPPATKAAVLRALTSAPWERLLRALATSEARPGIGPEWQFGWRVDLRKLKVAPTWAQPKAKGNGWQFRSADTYRAPPGLTAQDSRSWALHEAIGAYTSRGDGFTQRVEALVGHPRVFVNSYRVDVVAQPFRVEIDTRGHQTVLGFRLGEELLDDMALLQLLGQVGGSTAVLPSGATLVVCAIPPRLERLARAALKVGRTHPPEALEPLLEALTTSDPVPLRLGPGVRGERVEADARVVVQAMALADPALGLSFRVRPHPDGPMFRAGDGPAEVRCVLARGRSHVVRDLRAERARLDALVEALDPGPLHDDDTTLTSDADHAFELLHRLPEMESVAFEWLDRPTRLASVAARNLAVQARGMGHWLGLTGGLQLDTGEAVPLGALLATVRTRRRVLALDEGTWLRLSDELVAALEAVAASSRSTDKGEELSSWAIAPLAALADAGAELSLPPPVQLRRDRLLESATIDTTPPEALRADLRPYQVEGVGWLRRIAHWSPGACLADDMGLGKTVQALAFLLTRAELGATLVVAPASVGINWVREAARFAPSLQVREYRGSDRSLGALGPGTLLVTSYDVMVRDIEALVEASFATVVLDEAQAIKNASTARARAARKLQAGFTLALTGTPVENRVHEVWSLMSVLVPGLLGSQERFAGQFGVEGDPASRPALASLLRPFLLRRLKAEVARDLPPRSDQVELVELLPEDRALYDEVRLSAAAALQDDPKARFQMLAVLTGLRQIACHRRLFDPEAHGAPSAKLARLLELLDDLGESGHRALVFSQFTAHLDLVEEALQARGVGYHRLDGTHTRSRRQAAVDAFQAGEHAVFLVSLKAGGTGLNLTGADYVILLDPWWNPAVEDQASDRAHRIGQARPVTVIRLVARDTIEEAVLALHQDKRGLVSDLLSGTDRPVLSPAELLRLIAG